MLNKGYQIERTSYADLSLSIHERINDLHRRADGLAPAVSESALDSGCTDMTKASREQLGPRQRRAWDMVAEAHAWNAISDKPEELAKAEAAERAGRSYEVVGISGADFFFEYVVRVDGDEDEGGEGGQGDTPEPGCPCGGADHDACALANSFTVTVFDSHPEAAPVPAFVADPANPTDAELAAAIQRGLATGQLVDATDWLAAQRAQRAQDAIQASAARNGHATRCTAHGGRDLAACDPADCDEAALAASFSVTVRDDDAEPGTQLIRCKGCGYTWEVPGHADSSSRLCSVCFQEGRYCFAAPVPADQVAQALPGIAWLDHDNLCQLYRSQGVMVCTCSPVCRCRACQVKAQRSAQVAQIPQATRGHFHDPEGLTGYCTDQTCSRVSA